MDHTTAPTLDATVGATLDATLDLSADDGADRARNANRPRTRHLRPHPGDPFYFDGAGALSEP